MTVVLLTDIALGAVVVVGALLVFVLLLCTMICVEWYVKRFHSPLHCSVVPAAHQSFVGPWPVGGQTTEISNARPATAIRYQTYGYLPSHGEPLPIGR